MDFLFKLENLLLSQLMPDVAVAVPVVSLALPGMAFSAAKSGAINKVHNMRLAVL